MSNSGYSFRAGLGDSAISTELNENGDLTLLEFKRRSLWLQYKCKTAKKVKDRIYYTISGVPQLGIDAPEPPDREDLVDKEYSFKSLVFKPWVTMLVTLGAIIFDTVCYITMFEGISDIRKDVGIESILISIAAAVAIDVLPSFYARILHNLRTSQKVVLRCFLVISFSFVLFFIVMCALGRMKVFSYLLSKKTALFKNVSDYTILQALIPVATTLLCFIVSYISFDPFSKKLKTLQKALLSHTENLNELNALLEECKNEKNYSDRIKKIEDSLYSNAKNYVDAVGNHYRAYIRTAMMLKQHSPAETSDLSVFLEALSNNDSVNQV